MPRTIHLAPAILVLALALAACDEAGNQQSGSAPQDPQMEQQSEAMPDSSGTTETQSQ